ncbi:MAG: acyl--CoA ligase, partial [Ekhidna sp.]|nr:acyl--CoA ligase [Ekhidna sp.]
METDWIAKWAQYSPSKTVVRDNHAQSELTYSQLDNLANYLGQKLSALGIRKGDRVVILSEFRIELVVLFGVALKKGIILVPLNYRLST